MARLNNGEDYNGRSIDAETSFYIGVAVNPSRTISTPRSSASAARSTPARTLQ